MKRVISFILSVVIILSSLCLCVPTSAYSIGDINNDGKINAVDISLLKLLVLDEKVPAPGSAMADINDDGKINVGDIMLLRMAVVDTYDINDGPYDVREIILGGVDITGYSLVVPSVFPEWASAENAEFSAETLAGYIKQACGFILPVTDIAAEHNIFFLYDESFGDDQFSISVNDGECVIKGGAKRGLMYGAFGFLEEILDYRFYPYDEIYLGAKGSINIESGYTHTEGMNGTFTFRDVYTYSRIKSFPGALTSKYKTSVLAAHNLGRWLNNSWQNTGKYGYCYGPDRNHSCYALMPDSVEGEVTVGKVCFTSKDTYNECLGNLRAYLKTFDSEDLPMISISQNDSTEWCGCRTCNRVVDQYGANIATLVQFVGKLSDALKPEYPDIKFWSLSYTCSEKPPVGLEIPDNMYICFCEYYSCNNHSVDGSECLPENRGIHNYALNQYREDWLKLTKNIHIWYYAVNFYYSVVTMPIIRRMFYDVKYYLDKGVEGIFFEDEDTTLGFEPLKAYLLSELLWNPQMTWEEYDALIRRFLNDWYGEAGEEMYEYLFILEDAGDNSECFCGLGDAPAYCYSYEYLAEKSERIFELFEKGEKEVTGEKQKENLERLSCQMYFNVLAATYTDDYLNGASDEREQYIRRYKLMYQRFKAIENTMIFSYFPDAADAVIPETDEVVDPLSWYNNLRHIDYRWNHT